MPFVVTQNKQWYLSSVQYRLEVRTIFFHAKARINEALAVKTSKSLISRSGESVSIFIGFKTDSNAASGVSLCHFPLPFNTWMEFLVTFHQQFHQPKKSGHVSNIQSSSFASSWMSWPWPRLQLLEFQSLVLRHKFLVPVLTWHGLSRVLHDPPDVW